MATDVEAHVRRLWRHRGTTVPTPRRGPRQQLDLDEILDAGVALADTDGLAAVSIRSVAARFDKTAMALYPYVGTKGNLLALMQDHASAMPSWQDPPGGLGRSLQAWTLALFDVNVAHPWLAERPWAQHTQGPNEQDWMERLLRILVHGKVAPAARSSTVTVLYATVRACAETAAAYRRMDRQGAVQWRDHVAATAAQIPDLRQRYPLSTSIEPAATDWRDSPRAGLIGAVRLLAASLGRRR
jgi:AcrR family transcriptional regulator